MKLACLRICIVGCFGLAGFGAGAQEVGNVAGHVTCADSRTPCRFASVTIQSAPAKNTSSGAAQEKTHSYAADTGLDGAYAIKDVAPGEYYIQAVQAGYLSPYDLAGNETAGDPSLAAKAAEIVLQRFSVAAGQTATVNVLLSRGASLSGTVRYEDGGFAIGVSIDLMRKDGAGKWQPYRLTNGLGDLARLGFGPKTDDKGRFYAPGLPPGTYAVQMSLPSTAMLLETIAGTQSLGIKVTQGGALRVFYGDVYRLKDAKTIELHESEQRTEIDIDVPTSGMYTVKGLVTPKQDARDTAAGKVRLLDPDNQEVLREAFIEPEGDFSFENVTKGSYLLRIEGQDTTRSNPHGVRYEPLMVPLLVESDLSNLAYTLKAAKK